MGTVTRRVEFSPAAAIPVVALVFAIAGPVACLHAPGTAPHEMSARQHEGAARAVEASAGDGDVDAQGAARAHELAEAHRLAGGTLVDEERTACEGLDELETARGPFTSDAEIASVVPLVIYVSDPKLGTRRAYDRGAIVVLRARPGVTVEWIERLTRCHIAHASRVGHGAAALAWSPLSVRDVEVTVRHGEGGFVLEIDADDPGARAAVLSRARALLAAQRVSTRARRLASPHGGQ